MVGGGKNIVKRGLPSVKLLSTQRTFTAFSLYEIMTLLCAIFIFVFLSFIDDLHHVTYQSL